MFTKNTVQLTGNVAKNPETRTVGETSVTRARLIHNDVFRKEDGSTVERIAAIDLDIWGKRGEAFAKHITTKVPVYVEGRLQLDQWEHEGQPRSRLLIRVEDWQFIAAPAEDDEDKAAKRGARRKGSAAKETAAA